MITSQIPDFNLDFAGLNNRRELVFYENYINNIYFSVYCFQSANAGGIHGVFTLNTEIRGKVIRVLDGDTIEVLQDKQDKSLSGFARQTSMHRRKTGGSIRRTRYSLCKQINSM